MNNGEQDFEQLRKLLELKRYEAPPPGYFNRLPDSVMNRLEREEGAGETAGFTAGWAWLGALRRVLSENPISAGIFAVCGILMVVVGNSQYLDKLAAGESPALALAHAGSAGTHDLADNNLHHGLGLAAQPAAADVMVSSVNPVFMNAPDSLLNSLNAQPVSYSFNH